MNASESFKAGDLKGALAAVSDEIRKHPSDVKNRILLFELLTFAGELDRADNQLKTVAELDIKLDPSIQIYRNLVTAERQRRSVFHDGVAPELLAGDPQQFSTLIRALACLREGQLADAQSLITQAQAEIPIALGQLGDEPPGEFHDTDELLAPVFEFMIQRKYFWIPIAAVTELEITRPQNPRDLIWIPTRVVVEGQKELRGFMPVLYPNSHSHANERIRLGHLSEWIPSDAGPIRGVGQKTYQCGERDYGILELGRVRMTRKA